MAPERAIKIPDALQRRIMDDVKTKFRGAGSWWHGKLVNLDASTPLGTFRYWAPCWFLPWNRNRRRARP